MIKQSDSNGSGMARGPRAAVAAIALGALLVCAQMSGCASVRTRLEGGPLVQLTAQATGQLPRDLEVTDAREAPDGTWHWRASSGLGHEYVCSWMKGRPRAECGGDWLDSGMDPLQD